MYMCEKHIWNKLFSWNKYHNCFYNHLVRKKGTDRGKNQNQMVIYQISRWNKDIYDLKWPWLKRQKGESKLVSIQQMSYPIR